LYEPGLAQPPLELPFLPGRIWAFTGGPHGAWDREAAWAALDFAPTSTPGGCQVSGDWATAVAPGLIVRTGNGVVVLDLDGDGLEQTGWVITYLHVADDGRVLEGTYVEEGDLIGHPSCEGGRATGSHIHITRKYNGEWILADGPLPFVLSGWEAHAGTQAYQGALTKGDQTVLACYCVTDETLIWR
jgi:LasA protease